MKNNLTVPIALFAVLISILAACSGASDEPDPLVDPPGTATTQLVFVGSSSPSIRFATGSTTQGPFDLTLDTSANFRGTLASAGPVAGLGEITAVPTSGFVEALAAEVGTGYVAKVSDGLGTHYRVFVDSDILDTRGALIGKKIRWAPLSLLASMTISPSSPTVLRPPPPTNDNCSLDNSLRLQVATVTYTDGSAAGPITSASLTWTSDGPTTLVYDFIDEDTGVVAIWGGSITPGHPCPPTPISDYNVWVQADGNTPVATTVVKVRAP